MGKLTQNKDNNRTTRTKSNKKRFLEILKDKDCHISNACAGAKVGRRTYYEWMDADPEFNQAVKDVEESLKDDTEGWLIDACKKGNVAAIIYRCKTKCRDRGYDEHQQIGIIQPIQDVELEGL